MYNAEHKNVYLQRHSKRGRGMARETLEGFAPFEEELARDLCTFSLAELQRAVTCVMQAFSPEKRLHRLSVMQDYCRWCITLHFPNAQEHYRNVSISELDELRQSMLRSPAAFDAYLNAVFDPVSENTIDITYRTYCWLIYYGVLAPEAFSIRTSDVDLAAKRIYYAAAGEYITMYDISVPAFEKAITCTQFSKRKRAPGDVLVRGHSTGTNHVRMRSMIMHAQKHAELTNAVSIRATLSDIYASGLFYRVYRRELEGAPVDFSEVIANEMRYAGHLDRDPESIKRLSVQKERYLTLDYTFWKMAFYP